ncbi:MAG: two-component regulator propeller domain-containing protein [Chloracidobacterium sp.]|uniref:SpoIIE family protein phosphatase n=1 Tax=Chloracidobacterium validum TaxID=2821543 RepID=A0ABX8BE87_9BACT|nr:two-component regulator propeller domain-containing protein [Chloracidobacterium validum]QUW04195.1 SpoIIE family protein phosphatase [Chloracidobacterium validum]
MFSHLAFVLVAAGWGWPASAATPFEFRRPPAELRIAQAAIQCIAQDREGFLWLGTTDGLHRFDGLNAVTYRFDAGNPTSISANDVHVICVSRDGTLWIGTNGAGFNRYNRADNSFTRYQPDPGNPRSFLSSRVDAIVEDRSGQLWIGSPDGLFRFDPVDETFTAFVHDANRATSLSANGIRALLTDRAGVLWVGTDGGGLDRYDGGGSFTHFVFEANHPKPPTASPITDNRVFALLEARDGALWVGTATAAHRFDPRTGNSVCYREVSEHPTNQTPGRIRGIIEDRFGQLWFATSNGVARLNQGTGQVVRAFHDPRDLKSVSANASRAVFEDRSGIVWIGSAKGLTAYDPMARRFPMFKSNPDAARRLSSDSVLGFLEDRNGETWIGTADGLNRFDRARGTFEVWKHDPDDPTTLGGKAASALLETREGTLLVGTSLGLDVFDRTTGKFSRFRAASNAEVLQKRTIEVLYRDREGGVWAASESFGLARLPADATGSIKVFSHDPRNPNSLSNNRIWQIVEDSGGTFWLATSNGINRFDPRSETFTRYEYDPKNPKGLPSARVYCLCFDASGALWVGLNGGLARLDTATGTFENVTPRAGLSEIVASMLLSLDGELWIATYEGLLRFNPTTRKTRFYDANDGLEGEFRTGARMRNTRGEMFFGGDGFTVFQPSAISDNPFVPPVALTRFRKFDQEMTDFNGQTLAPLTYRENSFSFEFAALSFSKAAKNTYAYRLEGFDEKWIYCGARSSASYTNLDPGEYVFHVKAANCDGVWNEVGTSLRVVIRPPWWMTWWAYGLYAVAFVGGVSGFIRLRVQRVNERARLREARLRAEAAEIKANYAAQLAEQNARLAERNAEVEDKNQQILDSIRYAESIQRAMLPAPSRLMACLPEHCLLFYPRDIVSGDFYWFHEADDGRLIVAVADCTGHGVPGAMMAMLGANLLNQIVVERQVYSPAEILERLDDGVRSALKQDAANAQTLDGMDIALCLIAPSRDCVTYAGAQRPLFVCADGKATETIHGNRRAIGGSRRATGQKFENHVFAVGSGKTLWLTTDGFVDQNSAQQKKYGRHRLAAFLAAIARLPLAAQREALEKELDDYRGGEPLRDDVTMLGIRLTP